MSKPVSVLIAQAVLRRAATVIGGDRQEDYGTPDDSFAQIAHLFNAMGLRRNGEPIEKTDTPMAMVMLKLAREFNRPKLDNMVDTCGYAALHAGVSLADKYTRFIGRMTAIKNGPQKMDNEMEKKELREIAGTDEIYALFMDMISEVKANSPAETLGANEVR